MGLIDLTGQKFGRLLVIRFDKTVPTRQSRWWCQCDCGKEVSVLAKHLKSGRTKSCGCLRSERSKEKALDLAGQRFGFLTAKERVRHKGRMAWRCVCDCGQETIAATTDLLHARSNSCGCKRGLHIREAITKHNGCGTRLYQIWKGMRARCNNKNLIAWADYGGRGIKVCDEWSQYENFRSWAHSNGYAEDLTIDRIDVDGDYCPANCRWVTRIDQARNRRNTLKVDNKVVATEAEKAGVGYHTVYRRLRNGESLSDILKR